MRKHNLDDVQALRVAEARPEILVRDPGRLPIDGGGAESLEHRELFYSKPAPLVEHEYPN